MFVATQKFTVLVAIEPRLYRSTIGGFLELARPALEVEVVEPEGLRERVARLDPKLVLHTPEEDETLDGRRMWVAVDLHAEPTVVRLNGERKDLLRTLQVEDLLAVVDETVAGKHSHVLAAGQRGQVGVRSREEQELSEAKLNESL